MADRTASPQARRVVKARQPGQWILTAAVALLVAVVVKAFATSSNIDWSIVRKNLFGKPIVDGVLVTLELTFIAMAIGIALGIVVAVMRLSPSRALRTVGGLFVWLFRGSPVLVQLLLWFNLALLFPHLGLGIPFTDIGWSWDTNVLITPFVAAILGLGLNEGAYMAEIVRGGILAVDEGQAEASLALGMRRRRMMRRVILPQAMRVVLPPTGNEVVTMLKTTALVSVISGSDLLTQAQGIAAGNFAVIELLIVATVWYLALVSVFSVAQNALEQRMRHGNGPRRSALAAIRHHLTRWRS